MHMVTETRQLRDGEKLTEFYNRIDWKPLFEFVQRYYGIGVEQPPVPCLKPKWSHRGELAGESAR